MSLAVGVEAAVQLHNAAPAAADASTGTAGTFVPLPPGRILNTLAPVNKLVASTWRNVQITGVVNVPSTGVSAVAVTLTVSNYATTGLLYAVPQAAAPVTPPVVLVNYNYTTTGPPTMNSAIVALNQSNGQISVEATTAADLIIDVQGYYTASSGGSGTAPGGYVPVAQTRIGSTTTGSVNFSPSTVGKIANGSDLIVTVPTSVVPTGASSVFANITATSYATTDSHYLTPYLPTGTPGVGSLNIMPNVTTSIGAAIDISDTTRQFVLRVNGAGAAIDISVDIEGYFAAAAPSGSFTPGVARVFDSRAGAAVLAGATTTVQVAGVAGVPVAGSGIEAVAANLTVISPTAAGSLVAYADDQSAPAGLASLTFSTAGGAHGNLMNVQLGADGGIKVTNNSTGTLHFLIDLEGWYQGGQVIANGQIRTERAVTLHPTQVSSNVTGVQYRYRIGALPATAFTDVPNTSLSLVGGAGGATPAPGPVSATASYLWDLSTTSALGTPLSDTLVQVEGCFTVTGSSTVVCSPPQDLMYTAAFDDSHATTDAGPGTVSLQNGDYRVSATDVDVTAYLGDLTVNRSLTTLYPAAENADTTGQLNQAGVFGPGWTAGLPQPDAGAADVTISAPANSGYVNLQYSDGSVDTYQQTSASATYPITFVPINDATQTGALLTRTNANTLVLNDADGTITTWKQASPTSPWLVDTVVQPGTGGTTTSYARSAISGIGIAAGTLVTRIIAAALNPATACTDTNADTNTACRSLILKYSTAPGTTNLIRLTEVDLSAYDPGKSGGAGMNIIAIAKYDYQSGTGLLLDEYDPRLSNPLKTAYTYQSGAPLRLTTVSPPGMTATPWTISYDATGRVSTVSRPDPTISGTPTATTTMVYSVPVTGSGAPIDLGGTATAAWGQLSDLPYTATAVFGPTKVPSSTTASSIGSTEWPWSTITYIDPNGQVTNSASYGAGAWQYGADQYDTNGNLVASLTPANRRNTVSNPYPVGSLLQAASVADRAALLSTVNIYSPTHPSELTDTFSPTHPMRNGGGSLTYNGRDHTATTFDTGAPAITTVGQPDYQLPTSTATSPFNADSGTDVAAEQRITVLGYADVLPDTTTAGAVPLGWLLHKATTSTVQMGSSPSTADLVTKTRYNAAGQVIETRLPADTTTTGTTAATTQTSYYTPGTTNPASCLSNAWAGMVCKTKPADSTGNPLPTKSVTAYDMYFNTTTSTEVGTNTGGTLTRTTATTFDAVERETTQQVSINGDTTTAPLITYNYDTGATAKGLLLSTTMTVGGTVTQTLSNTYDALGRRYRYADANFNVSVTAYDIAGRVRYFSNGDLGTTYVYDDTAGTEHRGLVTSQGVTGDATTSFSATYDADGTMATQTYPNGIVATTTYDEAGNETSLSYDKAGSNWLAFTQTSGADGRVVNQTSSGGGTGITSQIFNYDLAGRLTRVRDTTTGAECTTRAYGFNANSDRTGYSTITGASGAACPTAATLGTTTFDTSDRITTTGYAYDGLGRTLTVPAADTNGTGTHTGTTGTATIAYYDNDMVKTETQTTPTSTTLAYGLDPDQNRITTISDGTTNYYSDDSDSPAWAETSPTTYDSYLRGIDGSMAGTITHDTTAGTTTAVVDLVNMQGSIVANAPDTAAATGLTPGSYKETTEYGLPRTDLNTSLAQADLNAVTPYGWLGSKQRSNDSLAGLTLMGVRLYNPMTGRFLSTDPVPGGNANAYTYPVDPINQMDLTGQCFWDLCIGESIGVAEVGILLLGALGVGKAAQNAAKHPISIGSTTYVGRSKVSANACGNGNGNVACANRKKTPARNANATGHKPQKQSKGKTRGDDHENRQGHGGRQKPNFTPNPNKPRPERY
ncbi:RHS repeat-associated protein [Jatrophihabitans sp. GAS493]|nr:RHS repeat-associated protein [Jatrophihabitans sp. GAS493]